MSRQAAVVALAVLLAAPGLSAQGVPPGPPPPPDEPRPDEAFTRAVKDRDPRKTANYAADAVLLAPHGEIVRGRDRIAAFWKSFARRGMQDLRLTPSRALAAGTLGYQMGNYSLTLKRAGGPIVAETGEYLSVFRRSGDTWLVVYEVLNNVSMVAPPGGPRQPSPPPS